MLREGEAERQTVAGRTLSSCGAGFAAAETETEREVVEDSRMIRAQTIAIEIIQHHYAVLNNTLSTFRLVHVAHSATRTRARGVAQCTPNGFLCHNSSWVCCQECTLNQGVNGVLHIHK